jgi:hypothetical protein
MTGVYCLATRGGSILGHAVNNTVVEFYLMMQEMKVGTCGSETACLMQGSYLPLSGIACLGI